MSPEATGVYEKLARHLDDLPGGYPATPNGVELRILRRLFTPEDAALALHLTLIPEEARVVALRAGLPLDEAERRLASLERKRLVSVSETGGRPRYMASQFIVGFWEAQVDRLTPELVRDVEEYLPYVFDADVWRKMPQMRVIPVGQSLTVRSEVMPYEQAGELVRQGDGRLSVSNCICRQEQRLLGKGCEKPLASCLGIGMAADALTRSGRGRPITTRQALDVLRLADESGLVLQAANSRQAVFLCTCCGCCCGVLRSLKRREAPADYVSTPFVAQLAADTCQGCGTCETRCQMEAIAVCDGTARLDPRRCLGCGLCVHTCPSGSLALVRKPESQQPKVPRTIVDNYLKLGQVRGRLRLPQLIGLQARSKLDRWRAR
ncbi:MAG: 4Fe-4S ferredoxin [Acidobacteria bacterium]|nr:4Fe-4S ferredoxin [Acidobacteriota bacterium]